MRTPLILMGVAGVPVVVGLIVLGGKGDAAEDKTRLPAVSGMTVEELPADASLLAARELARRTVTGTPAEQAAASSAITRCTDPRLRRNLAMAMALEQQKKQQQVMRRLEVNRRMVMDGPYREGGGWE